MNTIIENVKSWMQKTGFEGFAGLGIGAFLLLTGNKFWAGVSIGFFITKNWEIIKQYVFSKIKGGN